jgi:hypothetical protein
MLRVSPIGLAYASDPGRAFLIGAEAAALADGEFNSYLSAGVVSLIVALIGNGCDITEAITEAAAFIRPIDWPGEISEALRRSVEPASAPPFPRASASETLRIAVSAVHSADSPAEAIKVALTGGDSDSLSLAGQLSAVTPQGAWWRSKPGDLEEVSSLATTAV